MFTDKIELRDFDKMDPEYKELLGHVLAIQADCEIGGPHLYVETMLPAAPTKLDQLIIARTAAEEIDHFRKVARVARSDSSNEPRSDLTCERIVQHASKIVPTERRNACA